MTGDMIAWILGVLSLCLLVAAEIRRRHKWKEYRRELIRMFPEEENGKEQEM